MTYPISQPADNAAPYTYTQPIRDGIGGVNDHQNRLIGLEASFRTLFYDSFTRPDGAPGTSDSGHAYETLVGSPTISSKKVTASAAYVLVANVGVSDLDYSGILVPQTGNTPSLVIRSASTDQDRLALALSPTAGLQFNKTDGGVTTTLRTVAIPGGVSVGTAYWMRIVALGDTVFGYLDGVLYLTHVLTAAEQTEYGAYTRIGTRQSSTAAGVTFDNLYAMGIRNHPGPVLPNVQTGSAYTLVMADIRRGVAMNNAAANTLTIPPQSSVPVPVGEIIEIGQYGAGQTTITPGSGVTLRSRGGALKTAGQYAIASARKIEADEWWIAGDVTT